MIFYAKSNPPETIQEHTDKLLEQFDLLKSLYGSQLKNINWKLLKDACLYHDLGKVEKHFQNKLRVAMGMATLDLIKNKRLETVPHGHLSPAFLPEESILMESGYSMEEVIILYQAIYYHHHRPKNEVSDDKEMRKILEAFAEQQESLKGFSYEKINFNGELDLWYRKYIDRDNVKKTSKYGKDVYFSYIMTKGLLNRIDYAASSQSGIIEIEGEDLSEKVEKYFQNKLNELQLAMKDNQNKNCVVTAATGAGKTEAALVWIGKSKGFFTLPLKTSINAIFDRVRDENAIGCKNVGLLHSDTISEYYKRNEEIGKDIYDPSYYENTKLMSMPLSICTLDQIIDIVFKYPGFEYKLSTLAYSKVVVDEIQMYSTDLIAYLIVGLKMITELGGKFAIFTATFPPIFSDFLKENGIKFESISPLMPEIDNRLRHRIRVIERGINSEGIIESYKQKKKKILIIANTVKASQKIYDDLVGVFGKDEVKLLHGRFIKKDRKEKETELLNLGEKNNEGTGIWVSTQIVEASLDIDFDELHTELSDITGLFQRFGRVYRNRPLTSLENNIFVYVGGTNENTSGIGYVVDSDIFELSKKAILAYDGFELRENLKTDIINGLYTKAVLGKTQYYKNIEMKIKEMNALEVFLIERKEINLRGMDTLDVIPLSVYEENKESIHELIENKELNWKSKLNDFTVTLEYRTIKRYCKNYESLKIDRYNEIPICDFEYSFEKGIVYEREDEEQSDFKDQLL